MAQVLIHQVKGLPTNIGQNYMAPVVCSAEKMVHSLCATIYSYIH